MRTVLIILKNKFAADDGFEASVSKLFGEKGVIADAKYVLSAENFQVPDEILLDGNALIVVGDADVNVADSFELKGIRFDENGIFSDVSSQRFVSLVKGENLNALESCLERYIETYPVYWSKQVFKLFGTERAVLKSLLDGVTDVSNGIYYFISEDNLDIKVTLFFSNGTTKVEADKAIKRFILSLKEDIYAEDDTSLERRLVELLKLRRMVVSAAESMTGGLIASKIVSIDGASNYFYEGLVTYNTDSKIARLNVSEQTVKDNGVVSGQVAFEMAKGLLATGLCNLAVSVTGYASGEEKIAGKCFIGVGAFDNVDVYQYKFSGSRNQVREKTANAGLFLMIKKLSNI
ncbi:MAG: CinA family protein [Christensenellaceae bacterium]